MTPPLYPPAAAQTATPADNGYAGWTCPPKLAQAATILPTAGLLTLARIRVFTTLVTNVHMHITVGGGTLTANQCLAGLFTKAGVLLAATGNQATNWQSGGIQNMALTAPQTVTYGDFVYVGFYANGSTMPTFTRALNSSSAIANAGLAAPAFDHASADAGLTTAFPATFGVQTGTATAYWVAVS